MREIHPPWMCHREEARRTRSKCIGHACCSEPTKPSNILQHWAGTQRDTGMQLPSDTAPGHPPSAELASACAAVSRCDSRCGCGCEGHRQNSSPALGKSRSASASVSIKWTEYQMHFWGLYAKVGQNLIQGLEESQ